MSSPPFRWMLLLLASMFAAPASAGLTSAGIRDSAIRDVPAEFFCITPRGDRTEVCVTLYIDKNGYEICLSDELTKSEQCTSYHERDKRSLGIGTRFSPIVETSYRHTHDRRIAFCCLAAYSIA